MTSELDNDTSPGRQRTLRNVTIFSMAALICGWIGLWVDSLLGQSGDQTLGMLIWLGTPLTVSLLLRAFAGDGWRDLGLRLNMRSNVSMYLISLLLYPATGLIIIGAGALTGNVTLTSRSLAELLPLFGGFLLLGIPKNIMEEFAWRGYLAPKLFLLNIDTLAAHVLTGLIWGAWHLPYLAFVLAYLPEGPPTVVTRFLIGSVAASIVYGEIRLRTGSVWPAVLMHTVGGAFIATLLLEVVMTPEMAFLFSPGVEGKLTIAIFTLVGLGLYARRVSSPNVHEPKEQTQS
jgi:membrane protease YdiL (CAAX protease family)